MAQIRKFIMAGLLAALGGCATMTDSGEQLVEVHTIAAHREVFGAGCVLSNDAGRWFVVAPGRVTITRSAAPLSIDCAREGQGAAAEQVDSRFDTGKLIGNMVLTAGLGYLVDHHSGAGFSYPATLTVLMHASEATSVAQSDEGPANRVF